MDEVEGVLREVLDGHGDDSEGVAVVSGARHREGDSQAMGYCSHLDGRRVMFTHRGRVVGCSEWQCAQHSDYGSKAKRLHRVLPL
jgi:hypothetical protein